MKTFRPRTRDTDGLLRAGISLPLVEAAFNSIPAAELLRIANDIRQSIESDPGLVRLKDKQEYVTQADVLMQRCLLEHFDNSVLGGSYTIKAEEEIPDAETNRNRADVELQLLVDPLDGTNSFCNGEATWGCMVGLCDRQGRLLYSWNLLSTGAIYSSAKAGRTQAACSWDKTLREKGVLSIDVFDYGAGAPGRFPEVFESSSAGKLLTGRVRVSSYPAVWAGWELYQAQLSGLLWLPSGRGKRSYPDYDLSFLGALNEQGWRIALGKENDAVQLVAIAPSEAELQVLWDTGCSMIDPALASSLICDRDLQITSPITS